MAFPAVATNGQLYNTADGRQYKYILADDSWAYQSVQISTPKTNGAATAPPLVTDDTASGYGIGSIWVDVLANKPYIAVDVTAGAAIWVESTPNTKVQAAAPLTPLMGDHYLNTTDGFYYIWNGTAWVDTTAAGSGIKNNFVAVATPIVTNDSSQGYTVGSVWIDVAANKVYTLVDATLGNAIWSAGGGVKDNFTAIIAPVVTNDSSQGYSVGSTWIDTLTGDSYTAVGVTVGAAVWSRVDDTVPIGAIIGYGGSSATPPVGYLDANLGALASQAAYADLYGVIGNRFSTTLTATQLATIATNGGQVMTWHDTGTKLLLAVANNFNDVTRNINSVIYEVNPVTGVTVQLSTIATNGAIDMTWHDTGTKLLLAVANFFNDVTRNINSAIYEVNPVTGAAVQLSTIATHGATRMTWHDTGTKLLLAVANNTDNVIFNLNSVIYEVNPVTGATVQLSTIATNGCQGMTWHDTGTKLLLAVSNNFNGASQNINSAIYEVNPVTGVTVQLSTIATSGAADMAWHNTGTKLLLAVSNNLNGVTRNINSAIYEVNPVTGAAVQLSTIATHGVTRMTWHDTGTKLLLAVANFFNDVTTNINSAIYDVNPVTGVAVQLSTIATSSCQGMTWHDTGTKLLLAVANSSNGVTKNINSIIYEVAGTLAPAGKFFLPSSGDTGLSNALIKYK